jgi:hypothetical protein
MKLKRTAYYAQDMARIDDRVIRRYRLQGVDNDRDAASYAQTAEAPGAVLSPRSRCTRAPDGERRNEDPHHDVVRHSLFVCNVSARPGGDNCPESEQ